MVGALLPAGPCTPQDRAEDEDRQEEEDAGDFEPDFSADAAKGLEEAAQSAGNAAGGLSGDAASVGGVRGRLAVGRCCTDGLAFAHDGVAGHAACHPQPDAHYPADGFRFHFDMMVPAEDSRRPRCTKAKRVAGWPPAK